MHDAIVIGGGPAGLSAVIQLGKFTRTVLIIDSGEGRSSFGQINENYLGFPGGVSTLRLRELGRQQAARFGAEFRNERVTHIERNQLGFKVRTDEEAFEGRSVLLATGVSDNWPAIPGIEQWIGEQVFWCITCDGHRTSGKRVCCIGNDDEALVTVLQFLIYDCSLSLVADPSRTRFSGEKLQELEKNRIQVFYSKPQEFKMDDARGKITGVILEDREIVECDLIFSLLGMSPNTGLARDVGVELNPEGYVIIDDEGYTNIPGFFAAGDLTNMYSQQVSSAVHSGAEAAQTMNYYLYGRFQRKKSDEERASLKRD